MSQSKKKTASSKSIADVAHPGTSAPSDTSKPIINQRPIMKDPMMVEDDEKSKETEKPFPKKISETKIKPPEESKTDKNKSDKDKAEEPAPEEPEAGADEKAEETDKKKSPKSENDAASAAETAQDAKLQQIIDSKKYFLPINAVEHRRSKRVVVVGVVLALVLVVAWVDIALDASLIDVGGVKPVTHFFSN